jgi:hypothetical protein
MIPFPHSPRNIDLSTLSSTAHVSSYILLLHPHLDASGQTRVIAHDHYQPFLVSRSPRWPCNAVLLELRGRRRFNRSSGAAERRATATSRARGNTQEVRSTRPSTHLQCHGATALQANQSRRLRQSTVDRPLVLPARWAETRWGRHPWLFLERGVDGQHSCQRLGGHSSISIWQPSILGQPSSARGPNSLLETKIIVPGQGKLDNPRTVLEQLSVR